MRRATSRLALLLAATALLAGCGDSPPAGSAPTFGAATPAGYWEGKVSCDETPMQDHARKLTRRCDAEIWFTVRWDPATNSGVAFGEAQAVYDSVLTVKNLPKVTAPVPGGSVQFEPEVGGTLTQSDNKRRYPIAGALTWDAASGRGTLLLTKAANPDTRTEAQRLDDEARGVGGPDAFMEFTLRADPGVSGGLSGAAGGITYDGGRVGVESGGAEVGADVGAPSGVIVQKIPMKPFNPFPDKPGSVEKRAGGPFAASYEERGEKLTILWSAKQVGGESREFPRLTPEQQTQLDELLARLRSPSPGR
jgi:hypothetical protein